MQVFAPLHVVLEQVCAAPGAHLCLLASSHQAPLPADTSSSAGSLLQLVHHLIAKRNQLGQPGRLMLQAHALRQIRRAQRGSSHARRHPPAVPGLLRALKQAQALRRKRVQPGGRPPAAGGRAAAARLLTGGLARLQPQLRRKLPLLLLLLLLLLVRAARLIRLPGRRRPRAAACTQAAQAGRVCCMAAGSAAAAGAPGQAVQVRAETSILGRARVSAQAPREARAAALLVTCAVLLGRAAAPDAATFTAAAAAPAGRPAGVLGAGRRVIVACRGRPPRGVPALVLQLCLLSAETPAPVRLPGST